MKEIEDLSYALGMIRERERMNKKEGTQMPDWIDPEAMAGFIEMRKKIKAPLTERGLRMIINELERLKIEGFDPNECLDQSTMRSWRGVFPVERQKRNDANAGRDTGKAYLSASDRDWYEKMGIKP